MFEMGEKGPKKRGGKKRGDLKSAKRETGYTESVSEKKRGDLRPKSTTGGGKKNTP